MASQAPLRESDPLEISAYRLLGRLGEGGMGVVYLAESPDGHLVAVKVIRAHLAEHDDFRARFRAEVANASRVPRFCTAPILDSDTDADPPYIVTEYIDGPTLTAVIGEHGPLPGAQLHAAGVGIASALGAIHHAGVVHRDLKPGNVLLSRFGPQVIDFGIARTVDAVTHLTQPGRVMGSPSFMAPEQLRGLEVTPKADIFAWGAVMVYAGTGREPFGTTTDAVYYQVLYGQPNLEGLDRELAAIVATTLNKDPDERPTAPELLDMLVHSHTAGRSPDGAPWPAAGADPRRRPTPAPGPPSSGAPALGDPPYASDQTHRFTGADVETPPAGRSAERETRSARRHRASGAPPTRAFGARVGAGIAGIAFGVSLAFGIVTYLDFQDGRDESAAAVGGYLTDLRSGRFEAAYGRLCGDVRQEVSENDYLDRALAAPRVTGFTVDQDSVPFTLGDEFTIKASIQRSDGASSAQTFIVRPGSDEKGYSVCPR